MRASLQLLNQLYLMYLLLQHWLSQFAADFNGSGFGEQIGPRTIGVEAGQHLSAFRLFAPEFLGCFEQAFVFLLETRVVVGEGFPEVAEVFAFKLVALLHASFAQTAPLLLSGRRLFVHALAELVYAFLLGPDFAFHREVEEGEGV